MTVRIETKVIPAQTIKTTIVTIPAGEWRRMRIYGGLTAALLFGIFATWFFGVMVVDTVKLPAHFGLDILRNDKDVLPWMAIAICLSLPFFLLCYILSKLGNSLEPKLLKKHGWDGESNYKVELEYQTFMHE